MAKKWYIQFDVNDWIGDTACIRVASRGFWITAICAMWRLDQCGQISGTISYLAKVCICREDEARAAIEDIESFNVGDVQRENNGVITLINRRMSREFKKRQDAANRQLKHREKKCHTKVTHVSREKNAHSYSNSNSYKKEIPSESPASAPNLIPPESLIETPPKRARAPNPIWDVVVELFYRDGVPESQKSAVGKIVKDFNSVGATADEIRTRYERYRNGWPNIAHTARGLVYNWSQFGPGCTVGSAPGQSAHGSGGTASGYAVRRRSGEYPEDPTANLPISRVTSGT